MVLAVLAASASFAKWDEKDFPPRPVVSYPFSYAPGAARSTVIGEPRSYTFRAGDTLHDVARHLGLGINEVQNAYPELDVWLPPEGESVPFPTFWILPESDRQGVVVNIPEMRLYYFQSHPRGGSTVITYPVGLGRDDWQTPVGKFKVTEKTVDPAWVIPESIRQEHIKERGDPRRMIPGGDPENPLGRYRLRLNLPLYGIHGTNIAWGVGMEVSHGCVRLYPEDIERLYPLVPVGTPGEFVYQPVKIGARNGDVYIEVEQDVYEVGYDYWAEARRQLDDRGWSEMVDWGRVADALSMRTGVPTPLTIHGPLREAPGTVSEARVPASLAGAVLSD